MYIIEVKNLNRKNIINIDGGYFKKLGKKGTDTEIELTDNINDSTTYSTAEEAVKVLRKIQYGFNEYQAGIMHTSIIRIGYSASVINLETGTKVNTGADYVNGIIYEYLNPSIFYLVAKQYKALGYN